MRITSSKQQCWVINNSLQRLSGGRRRRSHKTLCSPSTHRGFYLPPVTILTFIWHLQKNPDLITFKYQQEQNGGYKTDILRAKRSKWSDSSFANIFWLWQLWINDQLIDRLIKCVFESRKKFQIHLHATQTTTPLLDVSGSCRHLKKGKSGTSWMILIFESRFEIMRHPVRLWRGSTFLAMQTPPRSLRQSGSCYLYV